MALRLIEMVLPEKDDAEIRDLLAESQVLEYRQVRLADGEVLVRILLDAKQTEAVLDLLEKHDKLGKEKDSSPEGGTRVVILPVEATLPRAELEPEPENGDAPPEKTPERISREELYEDIKESAQCTRVYLTMVVLSTFVAAVGLYSNAVTMIIGAMVIAPLLGPNTALALATALGDLQLLRQAILTGLAGIATSLGISVVIGALVSVDPQLSELASRTHVELGDMAVALASGCAGALAFTTGVSTTLIGVMVAVALLPPLVAAGLLLGAGEPTLALGAFSLTLINLICVNLAGVTTFLMQGLKPANWWEKDRAAKATRIAIALWVLSLALLAGLILL